MNKDSGRAPSGQALVASDEARSDLHPTGFDPSRLRKLAARCEAADAWDEQIDAEIECEVQRLIHPDARVFKLGKKPAAGALGKGRKWGMLFQRRDYTRSLDMAISLVPPDAQSVTLDALHCWPDGPFEAEVVDWDGDPHTADAASFPLALCAAALMARAAQAIEAGTAGTTEIGPVEDESAVVEDDAHNKDRS
jgi:hypothetical protein